MATVVRIRPPDDQGEQVTLGQIIRAVDIDHRDYSDVEITTLVIERVIELADPWACVFPAITSYVCNARRGQTRRTEHYLENEWSPVDIAKGRREAVTALREWLERFAGEFVVIPNVGRKRAGEVTVEEWEARMSELRKQIASDVETVSRLEAFVSRLKRAKVDTIDAYLERV